MSGQDEFARVDKAHFREVSSRACPVCGRGQFEPLRAELVIRPREAPGIEPIESVAQVCVRCGFLAIHATKYLLDDDSR